MELMKLLELRNNSDNRRIQELVVNAETFKLLKIHQLEYDMSEQYLKWKMVNVQKM